MLPNSDLLIGIKDGLLAKVNFTSFKSNYEIRVLGVITSMALTAESVYFFYGKHSSNIYWIETSTLKNEIRNTCHSDKINYIQFPYEYSGVFGTCGKYSNME